MKYLKLGMLLFSVISSSSNASGEFERRFIEMHVEVCDSPRKNSKYCDCEARLVLEQLTDAEKGYFQALIDIKINNPELKKNEILVLVRDIEPYKELSEHDEKRYWAMKRNVKSSCPEKYNKAPKKDAKNKSSAS